MCQNMISEPIEQYIDRSDDAFTFDWNNLTLDLDENFRFRIVNFFEIYFLLQSILSLKILRLFYIIF